MSRKSEIADAGIRVIATKGARALTHRAVDTEAGIPEGSTSYYARSRRDLLVMVIDRLAEHTSDDFGEFRVPDRQTPKTAARAIADAVDRLAERGESHIARLVLLFELRDNDELRDRLMQQSPVRISLVDSAVALLASIGARADAARAADLVGLVDALLMYRVASADAVRVENVLAAYLVGILAEDAAG